MIEAVPEKMEIKQAVFRKIDAATPGHAILSSNTSSLSVTEMGEATLRADKVVGFHFFYPASVMPLVEVIVGEDTSQETATAAYNFAEAIKKQPIVCGEVPGFVVNRILMATMGEIWRAQEEKGLSLKAIDSAIAEANWRRWGRSSSRTCSASTPSSTSPSTSTTPTATPSTSTRACAAWSAKASWG